ncbi:sensor histidine kinase [Paenibacillus sp. FSL K6-1096]|uniref:cache domain-containing sensor histidine kinase n=1 Tax=Paenibacillus sp. FSL K6-1096 TaxID=2921460 RepID=UPI0030EE8683
MLKRLTVRLRSSKMRTRLLLLFTMLTLLPLSVQGMVTYRHFSSTLNVKTRQFTVDIAGQVNANLDRLLKDMERLSLMPLYDEQVLSILAKYDGSMGSGRWALSDDYQKMKLYTSAQAYDRPEIRGIHLLSNSGTLFSNVEPLAVNTSWDARGDEWFSNLEGSDGEWIILPPHHPSYYAGTDPSLYISIARVIKEPITLRRLGYMLIDVKQEAFGSVFSKLKIEQSTSLIIIDGEQRLLYERKADDGPSAYGGLIDSGRIKELHSGERERLGGTDYLFVSHKSPYSGLSVIGLTPIGVIQKESRALMIFTLWLALFCLVTVLLLAYMVSYRITLPLVELKSNMLRVERGDFNKRISPLGGDEFGQLGRGFNKMMDEINRLFHEVLVTRLREKEAELSALQSQINPHFIYNTLESINMMAVQRRHDEVSDMVSALGKLLRYTIDKAGRLVSLGEEIAFVDSYIRIQQIRYGGKLTVHNEIEEEVLHLHIPKLTIQPLVENAIDHGLAGREEGGTIWVSALRFDNELLITVRDDGNGLEEKELAALNREIEQDPSMESLRRSDEDSLGLRNIGQRIKLLYGEGGSLTVDGSPGQGLAVTIMITIPESGGEEDV